MRLTKGMLALAAAVCLVAAGASAAYFKTSFLPWTNQHALAVSASAPKAATISPADAPLVAVYQQAWSTINGGYADRSKLPADWASWQHRYDGKIHNPADLTQALNDLVYHIGDPQVQLLTPNDVAALKARDEGGAMQYGMHVEELQVYGPAPTLTVHDTWQDCEEWGCSGGGEGQGHKDGLKTGDVLLAADGDDVRTMTQDQLRDHFVKHQDSSKLTIKRGNQILTITVHPAEERLYVSMGLDVDISQTPKYTLPFIVAEKIGPAHDAGITEEPHLLVLLNGTPGASLSPAQLKAISGECTPGEKLSLVLRGAKSPVVVPCGEMPYIKDNLNYQNSTLSGEVRVWYFTIRNLDASDVVEKLAVSSPAIYEDGHKAPIAVVIDLRGSVGNSFEAEAKVVGAIMGNGPLGCVWDKSSPNGMRCYEAKDEGVKIKGTDKYLSDQSEDYALIGKVAVLVDENTSGTALTMAAVLQHMGAAIISNSDAVYHVPGIASRQPLQGDPQQRWIQYPTQVVVLGPNGAKDFRADRVVAPGKELETAAGFVGTKTVFNDLR